MTQYYEIKFTEEQINALLDVCEESQHSGNESVELSEAVGVLIDALNNL